MPEWWATVAFGWPAIGLAAALAIAGILRKQWHWPIVASLIAIPFTAYLAGSPAFGWLALFLAPMLAVAGIAVRYRRSGIAWACLVPFLGVTGWIALVAAGQ